MDECNQVLARMHHLHFVFSHIFVEKRFFHFENQVGSFKKAAHVVNHFCTGLTILFVVIVRLNSGTCLYQHSHVSPE